MEMLIANLFGMLNISALLLLVSVSSVCQQPAVCQQLTVASRKSTHASFRKHRRGVT